MGSSLFTELDSGDKPMDHNMLHSATHMKSVQTTAAKLSSLRTVSCSIGGVDIVQINKRLIVPVVALHTLAIHGTFPKNLAVQYALP